jgi:hypothetical protein
VIWFAPFRGLGDDCPPIRAAGSTIALTRAVVRPSPQPRRAIVSTSTTAKAAIPLPSPV